MSLFKLKSLVLFIKIIIVIVIIVSYNYYYYYYYYYSVSQSVSQSPDTSRLVGLSQSAQQIIITNLNCNYFVTSDVGHFQKPFKRCICFSVLVAAKQNCTRIHTVTYIVYLMAPKTGFQFTQIKQILFTCLMTPSLNGEDTQTLILTQLTWKCFQRSKMCIILK